MRCSNCGFENPEKSKFCGNCGKALARDIENIKSEELTEEELEKLTEDERTKLQLYSFIELGCMILILFGLLLLFNPLDFLSSIFFFFGGASRSDIASIQLIGGLMVFVSFIVSTVVYEKERTIKKKLK